MLFIITYHQSALWQNFLFLLFSQKSTASKGIERRIKQFICIKISKHVYTSLKKRVLEILTGRKAGRQKTVVNMEVKATLRRKGVGMKSHTPSQLFIKTRPVATFTTFVGSKSLFVTRIQFVFEISNEILLNRFRLLNLSIWRMLTRGNLFLRTEMRWYIGTKY